MCAKYDIHGLNCNDFAKYKAKPHLANLMQFLFKISENMISNCNVLWPKMHGKSFKPH